MCANAPMQIEDGELGICAAVIIVRGIPVDEETRHRNARHLRQTGELEVREIVATMRTDALEDSEIGQTLVAIEHESLEARPDVAQQRDDRLVRQRLGVQAGARDVEVLERRERVEERQRVVGQLAELGQPELGQKRERLGQP